MKRLFLLLTLTCLCQVSVAQTDFCVPGATWVYYSEGVQAVNYEVEDYVRYWGDTAIGTVDQVKILRTDRRYRFNNSQIPIVPLTHEVSYDYVVQNSDSVLKLVDGAWELMFDYDVLPGDTRIVYIGDWAQCSQNDTMIIDSVYLYNWQGILGLRYDYRVLIQDYWSEWGWSEDVPEAYENGVAGSYMERLGFLVESPLTQPSNCSVFGIEYMPVPLICYTDDEILDSGGSSCSLILSSAEIEETVKWGIFFTNNRLHVQNAPNSTLRIFDILGKELFHASVNSDYQSFDINHLPNGILMVVLESEKFQFAEKVVKTSN